MRASKIIFFMCPDAPTGSFLGSTEEKRSVGDVSGEHSRVVVAGAEAWRRAAVSPAAAAIPARTARPKSSSRTYGQPK
jgi:hypothetical protein